MINDALLANDGYITPIDSELFTTMTFDISINEPVNIAEKFLEAAIFGLAFDSAKAEVNRHG